MEPEPGFSPGIPTKILGENVLMSESSRCDGSLRDLFKPQKYDGYLWFMPVARCLLQAIAFIHLSNRVHRDIHPGNVLYSFVRNEVGDPATQSLTFKVADLGISRLETDEDFYKGTMAQWMLPPEVLDPAQFGKPGDGLWIIDQAALSSRRTPLGARRGQS